MSEPMGFPAQHQTAGQEDPRASAQSAKAEDRYGRPLSSQQMVVGDALRLFREVESFPLPTPGLIGKWLRDLAHGDVGLLLFALDTMAKNGLLNVSLAYTAKVLSNGLNSGEFAELRDVERYAAERRRLTDPRLRPIGMRTLSGEFEWDGGDWIPVKDPTGGSGA